MVNKGLEIYLEALGVLANGKATKIFVRPILQNHKCRYHIQGNRGRPAGKGAEIKKQGLSRETHHAGTAGFFSIFAGNLPPH